MAKLSTAPAYLENIGNIGKELSGLTALVGTGIEIFAIYQEDISSQRKILQSVVVVASNIGSFVVSGLATTSLASTGIGVTATITVNYFIGFVFGEVKNIIIDKL